MATKSRRFSVGVGLTLCASAFAVATIGILLPVLKYFDAKTWVSVQCEVITANVHEQIPGLGALRGGTFGIGPSMDVQYRYPFGVQTYLSSRYALWFLSRNAVAAASQFAAIHPAGSIATCYVDPHHPERAIIDRSLPGGMVESAAFVLLLLVVGALNVYFGLSK